MSSNNILLKPKIEVPTELKDTFFGVLKSVRTKYSEANGNKYYTIPTDLDSARSSLIQLKNDIEATLHVGGSYTYHSVSKEYPLALHLCIAVLDDLPLSYVVVSDVNGDYYLIHIYLKANYKPHLQQLIPR